jgi:hypothetical protein
VFVYVVPSIVPVAFDSTGAPTAFAVSTEVTIDVAQPFAGSVVVSVPSLGAKAVAGFSAVPGLSNVTALIRTINNVRSVSHACSSSAIDTKILGLDRYRRSCGGLRAMALSRSTTSPSRFWYLLPSPFAVSCTQCLVS